MIVNAAPQFYPLGTDDKSIKRVPVEPIAYPSHLPKFYLFGQKGPVIDSSGLSAREVCGGAKALKLYGGDSFDNTKPYYNHATKFAMTILGKGNSVMFQRVIPTDNDKIANVTIYADILADSVKKYKRNTDGSIAYDSNGAPIEDTGSPIDGYRVKLIASVTDTNPTDYLGMKTIKTGYMTDANGNSSQMYPIVEYKAKYQGEFYNNMGVAIDLTKADDLGENFIENLKSLPYELFIYEKSNGANIIKKTLFGSLKDQFTFRKGVRNPVTNLSMDMKDVINNWYNTTNIELPLEYPDFETPYVYYNNIDTILNKVLITEKPYIGADITTQDGTVVNTSEWFDFVSDFEDSDQKYLINVFSGFSTKRVKYFSVVMDDSSVTLSPGDSEVVFSHNLPIFMGGGKDGTMNNTNYENLVKTEMAKYIDKNSEVMDLAVNVESIFYDSGFTVDTKKTLVNFIALRKDTFLVLGTRDDSMGERFNTLADDRAIAVNLKARLGLAPESTFFGTPVARAMIVAGSGIDKNDTSGKRWPLTLHVAIKAASMMGAGNQVWDSNKLFTKGEDNIITDLIDIQPAFVPQGVKPALWSAGLVWPERYDTERYYLPAMQTVYDNDTSVLNSFFTAMALTFITKVAAETHRKFTGVTEWGPDRLIEEVETYMNGRLSNKFAGLVKVITKATITEYDKLRGYSWTTVVRLGANNSRTVNTFYIEAYRMEELPTK